MDEEFDHWQEILDNPLYRKEYREWLMEAHKEYHFLRRCHYGHAPRQFEKLKWICWESSQETAATLMNKRHNDSILVYRDDWIANEQSRHGAAYRLCRLIEKEIKRQRQHEHQGTLPASGRHPSRP